MVLVDRLRGRERSLPYGAAVRPFNALSTRVTSLWIVALMTCLVTVSALPATSAAEPVRILGLGDSLMAGYGLPEEEAFPVRLENALKDAGLDVEITNAGVSGDTTAGGRARLEWSLAAKPDAVIVELGGNDGLRGIDPEETRRNLVAILDRLKELGLPTLLAGMLAPPNLGREYGDEFKQVFEDLANTYDVVSYPFFLDGVAADPTLNQPDGIHPNKAGVTVLVERFSPAAQELVARVIAKRAD